MFCCCDFVGGSCGRIDCAANIHDKIQRGKSGMARSIADSTLHLDNSSNDGNGDSRIHMHSFCRQQVEKVHVGDEGADMWEI